MNRFVACLGVCLCAVACCACGKANGGTTPTSPSAPPAPAPLLSITGAVTDQQSGRGIASATLTVTDGPDLNKTARTNSSGTYTLGGLQPGTITLSVTAAGYSPLVHKVTVQTNTTQSFTLLIAKRTISGTVTDGISRGVLPNILITVFEGPNAGQSTRTDSQGRYSLVDVSSETTAIQASAMSYVTSILVVAVGGDAQVDIVMTRTTIPSLPPVVVPQPPNPAPPAGGVVITLDGGSGTLTSYTEAGFVVTPTAQTWVFIAIGGRSLAFGASGTVSVDGEVRITAAGGARFQFQSVDVFSIFTPVPYVFTGMLGSTTVFTVAGRLGGLGRFATIASGQSGVPIDTLLISLTNMSPSANGNVVGFDNVVVTR